MENPKNEVRWYALYTRPRAEKKVRDLLETAGVECYLPLVKSKRIWSDRKKSVSLPMFRSYIFVHIPLNRYLEVLKTDGVVKFIKFSDGPVSIPDQQIHAIKLYEKSGEIIQEEETEMKVGDEVEICHGPMKGLYGTLISLSRRKKVRIMIKGVQQAVYIYIPKSHLRNLSGGQKAAVPQNKP